MTPTKTVLKDKLSAVYGSSENIDVKTMTQEFSTRQYYRICQNDSQECQVLQVTEKFPSDEENPFICAQKIYEHFELAVPQILATVPSLGWVLLEDLGDEFLQKEQSPELYKESLKCLVSIASKIKKENLASDSKLHQAPQWNWSFDLEKLQQEMAFTEENLFEFFLHDRNSAFKNICQKNSQYLSDRPRVFCHRDYHSRNIMVFKGQVFIIDFQDSRMGPLSYDLVSLLWDPYVPLKEEKRNYYLQFWMEQVKEQGGIIKNIVDDTRNFSEELERMKIQRLLKAAGSYAGLLARRGRSDYLPYIIPAVDASLAAIEVLIKNNWAFPEDEKLKSLLLNNRENILKEVNRHENKR